jgi:hypothetical protein
MVIKHLPFTFLPRYLSLPILFPNATVHIFSRGNTGPVCNILYEMGFEMISNSNQIIYVKKNQVAKIIKTLMTGVH